MMEDPNKSKLDELDSLYQAEKPHRKARPEPVTLIAFFQFFKGAVLVFATILILQFPDMKWRLEGFWQLGYVASHGAGKPGIFTPVMAIYSIVIGWGLWTLKRWARNVLMAISGVTSFLWIKYLLISRTIPQADSAHFAQMSKFAHQSVYMLVALDVLIFCCLAFYPDVAEAFGSTADQDPEG